MNAERACFEFNVSSNIMGNIHERKGKEKGQSMNEYYMDLWNNQVGRDIGLEVRKEFGWKIHKILSPEERMKYQDRIAEKILEKMNKGTLIINLDDKRINQLKKEFGADVNTETNEWDITRFIKKRYKNSSPTGYASVISDDILTTENRVFHNTEVNLAETKDKKLTNQVLKQYYENGNKMPTESELKAKVASGDLIYVDNYTRSDGTKVSGYYRAK